MGAPVLDHELTKVVTLLGSSVLMIPLFRRLGLGSVVGYLAAGLIIDVTIIDTDVGRIRNASKFGFKIYYGDGSRLDVLRTSGAEKCLAIAVCVDDKKVANHIVELAKTSFPQAKLLVRSYDRIHARELVLAGVDYQVRETFESAIRFGEETLRQLGVDNEEVLAASEEIRRRDEERFAAEIQEGLEAGRKFMHVNTPQPTPLIVPKTESQLLSEETEKVLEQEKQS